MTHKKPLTLSIIIPAYNEERHIKNCLESIATQTEKPDEVIVVDNNSTDATASIAKSYPFVKLIKENNQGIVFARNAGFNEASSDILGRIDADTVLPPGWVAYAQRFYRSKEHSQHALTGGGYFYNLYFPPARVNGWFQSQIAFRINRFIMGHYILWGSNMAMTAEQWRAVKDQTCDAQDIHEDLDLAIHLHRRGYQITYRSRLKVGVYMKRAFSDGAALYRNLQWWPRTLRRHGSKRWLLGWVGAQALFAAGAVLVPINRLYSWITKKQL